MSVEVLMGHVAEVKSLQLLNGFYKGGVVTKIFCFGILKFDQPFKALSRPVDLIHIVGSQRINHIPHG